MATKTIKSLVLIAVEEKFIHQIMLNKER